MAHDPLHPAWQEVESAQAPTDLFGKLDSLIQKHQGRAPRRPPDGVPMLTEPVEDAPPSAQSVIPVLEDVVDANAEREARTPAFLAHARRQLQVALYLRLRQRLDIELEAALADDLRLGAVAVEPAFSRVTEELRAVLPLVVRESVEQVLGQEWLEALFLQIQSGSDER